MPKCFQELILIVNWLSSFSLFVDIFFWCHSFCWLFVYHHLIWLMPFCLSCNTYLGELEVPLRLGEEPRDERRDREGCGLHDRRCEAVFFTSIPSSSTSSFTYTAYIVNLLSMSVSWPQTWSWGCFQTKQKHGHGSSQLHFERSGLRRSHLRCRSKSMSLHLDVVWCTGDHLPRILAYWRPVPSGALNVPLEIFIKDISYRRIE